MIRALGAGLWALAREDDRTGHYKGGGELGQKEEREGRANRLCRQASLTAGKR